MILRQALSAIRRLAAHFRVVVVSGPRQAGKTTCARMAFPDHAYATIEDPDVAAAVDADARGWLGRFSGGVIIDEAQRRPGLLSYIQGIVDAERRPGRFVLTGSGNLLLHAQVAQSLAGRACFVELPTLAHGEMASVDRAPPTLAEAIVRGGFPEITAEAVPPVAWYNAYLTSFIERDVRQLLEIRDLGAFQRFLRLCAARSGQLVNKASLGADAGITAPTVDNWLSALQAAHLVLLLPPHHRNLGKRVVKAPKLYFTDVGLATRLMGISTPEQAEVHPNWGSLVETWAVNEVRRIFLNRGEPAPLAFWRDHRGAEIDLIVESAGRLCPVEIKAGTTLAADWFTAMAAWRRWAGDEAGPASLVYGGETADRWAGDVRVIPWRNAGMAAEVAAPAAAPPIADG